MAKEQLSNTQTGQIQNQALTTADTAGEIDGADTNLMAEFRQWLFTQVARQELAKTSAETYWRGASRFYKFCGATGRNAYDAETVKDWKAHELSEAKAQSVNTWLCGVRALFDFAKERGLTAVNPVENVKRVKRQQTQFSRDYLSDSEARAILDYQPTANNPQIIRAQALAALMLFTGIRTCEAQRANVADLREQDGKLTLDVVGKGKRYVSRFVVIPDQARTYLTRYMGYRTHVGGALFVGFGGRNQGRRLTLRQLRGDVKGLFAAVGIDAPNKTTHSLRHTAGTKALQTTGNLRAVQEMLGHDSPATTAIYSRTEEKLRSPAEEQIDYQQKKS